MNVTDHSKRNLKRPDTAGGVSQEPDRCYGGQPDGIGLREVWTHGIHAPSEDQG